jgi:ABC-2 type transport system ATP-binding protein
VLTIENLRVDYADVTAVDGLSLTIERGQIFGLVGPNGAGKTSTIRVVATLLEPTYGRVCVAGHDVSEHTRAARCHIGYMPDLAPVNPDLRIEDFLEYFDRSYGLPRGSRQQRIAAAIAAVGLQAKRGTPARHLSRGLSQRLVLAKTLLHRPSLLLLDEPASGMDPIARRELRDILRTQAAAGVAILISSHIIAELADMCTHVGVMRQGRLCAAGSIAQITALSDQTVRPVTISVLERAAELVAWLREQQQITSVASLAGGARCDMSGSDADAAGLLAAIIGQGFAVRHFEIGRPRLEDVLTTLSVDQKETDR